MERIRVCVVGATGFAGIEVCRLVLGHPNMELAMATDRKEAGTRLDAVYPSFAGACDLELSLPEPDAIAQAADVAFLAVPHTASLALTPELLRRGVTVLDLSADYRLHDPQVYEQWYNTPHASPELLSQTVYGLPELNREGILALAERRAAGQAVLEGDHRAGHAHAGDQAAHEGCHEKGDDDVHACDAEDQHDEHGEHDCVEKQHECSCVEGARKRHVRWRK